MNWAAYLEYLQTVLKEFDLIAAPNKNVLIWYFQNGLRPSIQSQNDKRGRDLDTWQEAIKKPIEAEV